MSEIGVVATGLVVVSAWLVFLTVVNLALLREMAILRFRFDSSGGRVALGKDGIELGLPVPAEAMLLMPELSTGLNYLVLLTSTCTPCRELAPKLGQIQLPSGLTALVPGRRETADGVVDSLPARLPVLRDPVATELAKSFQVSSAPFALQIEDGILTGKAYLKSADDLTNLVQSRDAANRELVGVEEMAS